MSSLTVIPFPEPERETLYFTKAQVERFRELKKLRQNSISPAEATYYTKELDALVSIGRVQRP